LIFLFSFLGPKASPSSPKGSSGAGGACFGFQPTHQGGGRDPPPPRPPPHLQRDGARTGGSKLGSQGGERFSGPQGRGRPNIISRVWSEGGGGVGQQPGGGWIWTPGFETGVGHFPTDWAQPVASAKRSAGPAAGPNPNSADFSGQLPAARGVFSRDRRTRAGATRFGPTAMLTPASRGGPERVPGGGGGLLGILAPGRQPDSGPGRTLLRRTRPDTHPRPREARRGRNFVLNGVVPRPLATAPRFFPTPPEDSKERLLPARFAARRWAGAVACAAGRVVRTVSGRIFFRGFLPWPR